MTTSRFGRYTKNINATAILVMFFILSAGIRLTAGPLPSLAKELRVSEATRITGYPERNLTIGSDVLEPLIAGVEAKRKSLAERETVLEARERSADLLIQSIAHQLAELEAMEARLEGLLVGARTAAETDIAQLVSVYESMNPKNSARIFSEMPPDFAAGFLARMQPEIAGRVVAELPPEKAYSISVILAGRNL